jgi:transposase-like protein
LDTTVSHHSTEAEIKALDEVIKNVVATRALMKMLGHKQKEPTKIFIDNKSAIELCTTLKTTHKVRHINLRIHYIRQMINERVIELHFVPTELNVADLFTKALAHALFVRHMEDSDN